MSTEQQQFHLSTTPYPSCSHQTHPGITSFLTTLTSSSSCSQQIGHIKTHIIECTPHSLDDDSMWTACQSYDAAHAPDAKLDKVENYLANESFPAEIEELIRSVEVVVFVEEVWLEPGWRGRGLGREVLGRVLRQWRKAVVLLQPGPVGPAVKGREVGADEATERIERGWRRMGFEAWSGSDGSWLCLCIG